MKILLGDTRGKKSLAFMREHGWGRLFASAKPTPQQFEPWGFDNRAYLTWKEAGFPLGLTLDDWAILYDVDDFERRLAQALQVNSDPIVAVVPDIPGSEHSLEYSLSWLPDLPTYWPWYLAVQDGMTQDAVLEVAHLFAGIFLGGTDKFKRTAYRWSRLAHFADKKFHYGRAGTLRKIRHAYAVEADSLDSSFPLWTVQRMNIFRQEQVAIETQEQGVLV